MNLHDDSSDFNRSDSIALSNAPTRVVNDVDAYANVFIACCIPIGIPDIAFVLSSLFIIETRSVSQESSARYERPTPKHRTWPGDVHRAPTASAEELTGQSKWVLRANLRRRLLS